MPDLHAVILQTYLSANPSTSVCCAMAGEDFIYPATEGVRPEKSWVEKQVGAYMADLLENGLRRRGRLLSTHAGAQPAPRMLMMC